MKITFGKRKRLNAGLLACVCATLSGCAQQNATEIKPPQSWQAHLETADLPTNLVLYVQETIYVPIYSHIYHEDDTRFTLLTGTLSIRNTDSKTPIILRSIKYYASDGKMLQDLCPNPVALGPMATADIVVPRTHSQGGSGANFIVDWVATRKVSEPLVEAVMISSGSAQDLSFVSRGVVTSHTEADSKPATGKEARR
jgi:hypothetical protein